MKNLPYIIRVHINEILVCFDQNSEMHIHVLLICIRNKTFVLDIYMFLMDLKVGFCCFIWCP